MKIQTIYKKLIDLFKVKDQNQENDIRLARQLEAQKMLTWAKLICITELLLTSLASAEAHRTTCTSGKL